MSTLDSCLSWCVCVFVLQEALQRSLKAEGETALRQTRQEWEERVRRAEREREELQEEVRVLQRDRDQSLLQAETEKQQVRWDHSGERCALQPPYGHSTADTDTETVLDTHIANMPCV